MSAKIETEVQQEAIRDKTIARIENISKRYGRTVALDDVSLKIPAGRLSALIGPNGSGKTTMLKILAGMSYPDSGEVRMYDYPLKEVSSEDFAFQPEIDHLYNWMKIRGCLKFYDAQFSSFSYDKALELLEGMNLDPSDKISGLSRGMKGRFKLVLSLARDVKLYILDEPLAGIDPGSRSYILETLNREFATAEENKTVILSTHEVVEAEKFFDYVIMLENGQLKLTGYADDLREEYQLSLQELSREVLN